MADKKPFIEQVRGLPANFWYACTMEIIERLAFFGVRAVAPLYLVKEANENGLDLSFNEKGIIYGVWALVQCLVPMVSGGYTDRYGYRKSLAVAFTLNIIGYLFMANSLPITQSLRASGWQGAGFWVFMAAACFVALGTAIFKPPAHGTIAKSTDEKTSSLGWGIFYWTVNIGGALAPMGAAHLRGEIDWHIVFYAAAIVTALNFLPAFLLYKEPPKEPPAGAGATEQEEKGPVGVFIESIALIARDARLVVFLAIFSCFWLMFMQLWDLLPNFIDEWVDTSDVATYFGAVTDSWILENGQTKPEMIINLNPLSIIILVIPISALVGRINKVAAMVIGMVISMVGFVAAGATPLGWFVCAMILVFSIGEMTCSPTFSAYVGQIAPLDKKALYMGYSNIPYAIGWAFGNVIGGKLYESLGSKVNLARAYMVEHLSMTREAVDAIKDEHVLAKLSEAMPAETVARLPDAVSGAATPQVTAEMRQVTQILWDTYRPDQVWYWLGAIGLLGTLGMLVFYLTTRKSAA